MPPRKRDFVAATELAVGLMGDSIATNMFMLGYAYQQGWVPLSGASLERAIELNGVAVDFNRKSFLWGRRAAVDLEKVKRIATPAVGDPDRPAPVARPRRADRAPHQIPRGLPGRALCGALSRPGGPGAAGGERQGQRFQAHAKRWRAITPSCSPTRTSTKWRASTPTATSAARSRACSRATTAWCSTSPRRSSRARTRSPASRARCASGRG